MPINNEKIKNTNFMRLKNELKNNYKWSEKLKKLQSLFIIRKENINK